MNESTSLNRHAEHSFDRGTALPHTDRRHGALDRALRARGDSARHSPTDVARRAEDLRVHCPQAG